jgi:hypothetical protein
MSFENEKYNYRKYLQIAMIISTTSLLFAGCKIHYDPPVNSANEHYLVVEGYINTNGPTQIKLTRTRSISRGDTAAYINETGATVVIRDNQNNFYPLTETGTGNYSATYHLDSTEQYQLQITTSDNKIYRSDFVSCQPSPAIQDFYWDFNQGSVWVYINTSDPHNKTHYYRWEYSETWEFHSQYYSILKYNPNDSTVIPRTVPVFVCYRSQHSSEILLSNTTKLQQDIVSKKPLIFIPTHDRRISVLYSALVTQYALDSTAYSYWNAMKGNSKDIGSIFGPQPNQTPGNIHNINDSSEKVIGYIGAGTPVQRRLFISNSEMPAGWNIRPTCTDAEFPNSKETLALYFGGNSFIPIIKDTTLSGDLKGFISASGTCVDCTLAGGTLVKPSFWP